MNEKDRQLRRVAENLYAVYFRTDGDSPFGKTARRMAEQCNAVIDDDNKLTFEDIEKLRKYARTPEYDFLNQLADKSTPGEFGDPLRWHWDGDVVYVHNAAMLPEKTPATLMFVIQAHQPEDIQNARVRRIIDRMLRTANAAMKLAKFGARFDA